MPAELESDVDLVPVSHTGAGSPRLGPMKECRSRGRDAYMVKGVVLSLGTESCNPTETEGKNSVPVPLPNLHSDSIVEGGPWEELEEAQERGK